MGTRKKFWVGFGALAMIAVMTFTSIGLTWAAVTLNVNSEFSVSYTAKKVNAIISGKYITGSTSGSLGEDLTFSADTKDTTKAFANVPVVKFVSATDFLELQFTIRNTGEDGFGVKLSLTGAEDSNFSVKYSKSYRSSTATPATFGAENGKSSLSNMYVTSVTTAKSVLDISVRISVIDASISGRIDGNFNFELDGLAEPPQDIYDEDLGIFVEEHVTNMFQMISGDTTITPTDISKLDTLATQTQDAEQIRQNYSNYLEKTSASAAGVASAQATTIVDNVTLEIGGLTWSAVYLSKSKSGDTILTLWLTDSSELNGLFKSDTEKFDRQGTSNWAWTTFDYPYGPLYANTYGNSYISRVILNNAGICDQSRYGGTPIVQNPEHAFAAFTMSKTEAPDDELYDMIVTPSEISWQESGTSEFSSYHNEFWTETYEANWAQNPTIWKDDKLWLPSLYETGDGRVVGGAGFWNLHYRQRDNCTYMWLRTGDNNTSSDTQGGCILRLTPWGGTTATYFTASCAVRPAFHLNLTKMAAAMKG